MESSVFIDHLKNSHQSVIEEIDNSDLKVSYIRLVYSKGLAKLNSKKSINNSIQAEKPTEKINSLLPKGLNSVKLNLFGAILKNLKNNSLSLNVPFTLLKTKDSLNPYLIQTSSSGKVQTKESSETEFFQHKFNTEKPIFCYKNSHKGSIELHDIEDCESLKNKFNIIQEFIYCKTSQISITRTLWILGKNTKYFTIIKRNKKSDHLKINSKIIPKNIKYQRRNSSFNELSTFIYTDFLLKSSQSINNPFKVRESRKSVILDTALKVNDTKCYKDKLVNKSYSLGAAEDESENYQNLILRTEKPHEYFTFESKKKIPEIEEMITRLVFFLNHNVFISEEVSGIVLDFIQGKDNKWYLLDCKECSTIKKNDIILKKNSNCAHLRVKSMPDLKLSGYDEEAKIKTKDHPICENFPIKGLEIRKHKKPSKIVKSITIVLEEKSSEKELFKRFTLLSNKIDKIVEKNHLPILPNNYIKEQSIHAYNDYVNSCSIKSDLKEEMSIKNCPFLQHHNNQDILKHKNKPLWDDESHAFAKKCYSDISEIYDEMKINSKNISLNKNFISKYGGDIFWDKFAISLYGKFISDDKLNKYFKNSCQKMVYSGFHQIFSGNSNIEFRRTIRNAHQSFGIAEKDFYRLLDKFEEALVEFRFEEDDKVCIMSQIRSMMCLVCKVS